MSKIINGVASEYDIPMKYEKKPYLIINKECDEIQINIKHTKPYMKLQQENKQLKEVIEEVREYIEKECSDLLIGYLHRRFDATEYYEKLLQILDKVKESK